MSVTAGERVEYRTCPLCEATCGLEVTLDGETVTKVRGDADDVFSKGFICPKGANIGALHADPDRLASPLVRRDGELVEASWEEAYEAIAEGLGPILAQDRGAVGTYFGNPNAHNLSNLAYNPVFIKALGSKARFSASSLDQLPKQLANGLMFGSSLTIAIPDIDRTDLMVLIGANPLASNGSMMTVPDFRGRLRAIRERGGRVVVIDPNRTRTADEADLHLPIRPGTDALLLFAIVNVLVEENLLPVGLERLGATAEHLSGVEEVCELSAHFAPETVAPRCGITPDEIRTLARDLAGTERACVYGRIGTCTQEFGTVATWLVDVINTLTGHLDREGGVMFPNQAAAALSGEPGQGRGVAHGRWKSRVRGFPESLGELPSATMAEEIDTPGEGRLRAMFTIGGNPILSSPNGERLKAAFESLDFMVSVDAYLNETTSLADVVLPTPSPLRRSHYDLAFYQLSIRNIANYSPALLPIPDGMQDEWVTLLKLALICSGQPLDTPVDQLDAFVALQVATSESSRPGSPAAGRDPAELVALTAPRVGPERLLDLMLRCGPYGDGFGADPDGLSLDMLEANPHGVDLGPLQPRIPEVLRTPSGTIELAPGKITADVPRLIDSLERHDDGVVLIGRRHLRSNNSWMHNIPGLVSGPARCTLLVHPTDASAFGLEDGAEARVSSRVGSLTAPVEVTEAIMPGVVSLPHGWGHGVSGTTTKVANDHPGVNSNVLTDEAVVDAVSGNAVLNGIPVELAPA
ncbi:MAG: molybdopterin oxidoreductase family protein [Actinomycetes bacterium]